LQQEELIVSENGERTEGIKEFNAQVQPGPEKPRFEPPILRTFEDMQDLLLLDPIHEVDEMGWPNAKKDEA
jgi:hypothetical protein